MLSFGLLESLIDVLEVNPRMAGEQHPGFDGSCWVYESPPIGRLPRFYCLYQILDQHGIVWLHNFDLR